MKQRHIVQHDLFPKKPQKMLTNLAQILNIEESLAAAFKSQEDKELPTGVTGQVL